MGFASARGVALIGAEGRMVGLAAEGKNVRSLVAVAAGVPDGWFGVEIGLAMRWTRTGAAPCRKDSVGVGANSDGASS
jgi:hypothetical protein